MQESKSATRLGPLDRGIPPRRSPRRRRATRQAFLRKAGSEPDLELGAVVAALRPWCLPTLKRARGVSLSQRPSSAGSFGAEEERDDDDPDDTLPLLQSASVAGRSAVRQRKARRVQRLWGKEFALPPLCAASEGYSLHAGVLIGARDAGSERRKPRSPEPEVSGAGGVCKELGFRAAARAADGV